jgi:hypothetical protein
MFTKGSPLPCLLIDRILRCLDLEGVDRTTEQKLQGSVSMQL